jgi:uncharacterized protein YlxW (UPF0749 family)
LFILGFAIVLSVRTADPGPRLGSRGRLVDLIADEDLRARILREQLEDLRAQLDAVEASAATGEQGLRGVRHEIGRLDRLAGMVEVDGPGVVVELRDSSLQESPTGDPNDLVIHEQDLQAVVNGLWAAGAEAMAINGERITSSSAVRCVGNTLLLHGSVYAPPYRVEAIGAPRALLEGMYADPLVERFRAFAEEFRLGFAAREADPLRLPGFRGGFMATVART